MDTRLQRIDDLLSTMEGYYRIHFTSAPASFNLFNLFASQHREIVHSRLLYWILDPQNSHRQGTLFLEAFLELVGLDVQESDLHRCYVGDEGQLAESRVDVLLFLRADFLVYAECKIDAGEQPEQIDREYRDLRRNGRSLRIPEGRQIAVFLTLDGRKPTSGDSRRWKTMSYTQLADKFRPLIPRVTSEKVRMVLQDWMDVISSFGEWTQHAE